MALSIEDHLLRVACRARAAEPQISGAPRPYGLLRSPGQNPSGSDGAAVREDFAGVFEEEDAVAQQAPPLFRVARDDDCGLAVRRVG
ncbi:hypothetical protein I2501_36760 [Streptacidiphilus sp. NEAU-YB345]|uniref:Uncharacterized protein n=1 Tax=Streptacidiphilus fuscans TaxID=2789292 RepID=A0A931FKC2_9ACTN|nr:hypothetical protein [Streptacidiphilus fuscans]